jgi:hypothetical protein
MMPYYYRRSSRSWASCTFLLCGIICLLLAYCQHYWNWFGKSPQTVFSLIMFGLMLFIFGLIELVIKKEWVMQIDNQRLLWKSGKQHHEIPINIIRKVCIEDGDGRYLIVQSNDGEEHRIPGEFYGNAPDLREWFRENLGSQLEHLE